MTFSSNLRALIEERSLTQKTLANDLNIAPSTMGGYVQGTSEPDFEILNRIADYFQVSTDYLLGRPDIKTNDTAEIELLRVFRSLAPDQQSIYLEQGKAFLRINQLCHKKAPST